MRAQLLSQRLRYVGIAAIAGATLLATAFITRAPTRLVPVNRVNLLTALQVPVNQSVLVTPQAPPAPKISVLVIWEGGFPYSALIQFFNSFRANAPLVELVWIGIRKDEEDRCLDINLYIPGRDAESNIRSVCLTRRECASFLIREDQYMFTHGPITSRLDRPSGLLLSPVEMYGP